MKSFNTMSQAESFLREHMPVSFQAVFSGSVGLHRTRLLLHFLGNPQERYVVTHIAGTSGKGSTAYYLSELLRGAGFRTGLSLSPHIQDIRERVQVDGRLISRKKFCTYLSEILPAIEKTALSQYGSPTRFEILTALAFYAFFRERVAYAVMETGLGGLLDARNVVSRSDKVSIITRIGLDHTAILGKTLSAIAEQKAGIIQRGNAVIALFQKSVWSVFQERAISMQADLYPVYPKNAKHIRISGGNVCFDARMNQYVIHDIILPTVAKYQTENALLAVSAFIFMAQRDGFSTGAVKIRSALSHAKFLGRMDEFVYKEKTVWLDGAHNPQKMRAFLKSLSEISKDKMTFLVAFKRGKQYSSMLEKIIPKADCIVATNFLFQHKDTEMHSVSPKEIISFLESKDFRSARIFEDPKQAFLWCLEKKNSPIIIVTGSLYFLGTIYSIIRSIKKK